MFSLAFDRRHNVLLTRFSGVFNSSDIDELDNAIVRFAVYHGPAHGILDFSSVVAVSVPMNRLLHRARQAPVSAAHKRVIVAADPELFQIASRFTAEQSAAGTAVPLVVASMDEALEALGVKDPVFEPLANIAQL